MSGDQVFVVDGSKATRAEKAKMANSSLLERNLQEWIKEHPDLLGEELLVITEEFDRWVTASGERTSDRLDILALDRAGGLVVAELKRHQAPNAVLVQALNYAAMASRFTVEDLVDAHARFLEKEHKGPRDGSDPKDHARERLQRWSDGLADANLSTPRIVLVAEDFGAVLTNTALFLIESGMDLRLVRLGLHRLVDGTHTLTTSQLLPVPLAEGFMIRPGATPPSQRSGNPAPRRSARLDRLLAAGVLADGEPLTVVVPTRLAKVDSTAVEQWLSADSARTQAQWRNDSSAPLLWRYDGSEWPLTQLVQEIVRQATGEEGAGVWGFAWLQTNDGRTLAKITESLPALAEE